jgi:hypothetical protein
VGRAFRRTPRPPPSRLAGEPTGLQDSGARLRWPEAFTAQKLEEVGETGILPKQLRNDAQRLLPGTIITRIYDDIEHRVLVRGAGDFDYQGQRFRAVQFNVAHIHHA